MKRETMLTRVFGTAVLLSVSASILSASAEVRTWVGASGSAWSAEENWNPVGVPSGTDVAVFSPGQDNVVTVKVANGTGYCETLRFSSGATVFVFDDAVATYAYTSFGSNPTGVVEVAEGAVFTNDSVQIEDSGVNLRKTGAGAWVQQRYVCYDKDTDAANSLVVEGGVFELSGPDNVGGYMKLDNLHVGEGASFLVYGYSRLGSHPISVHVDGTVNPASSSGGVSPVFSSLTGTGTVTGGKMIKLQPENDCRFDGTVKSVQMEVVHSGDGGGSLIVGATDTFKSAGKVFGGNALKFAPGIGFFRFNMLELKAGETVVLEDTAGAPVTVEANFSLNSADTACSGHVSGSGNVRVRANTLKGTMVRSTGSLFVDYGSTTYNLTLGDGTTDFDFSTVSDVGSYSTSYVKFRNTAALDLEIPLVGNGNVDIGDSTKESASVTIRNARKTGGCFDIYEPLVLKSGVTRLGYTGFKFKRAGASLTIEDGEFSRTLGLPDSGSADPVPFGTTFSTADAAVDSWVRQTGGVLYHAGDNGAAMRYDLEGGTVYLTQSLQAAKPATAENPSVYCLNGGELSVAYNLQNGIFNNGLFRNPDEGRLRILLGEGGVRLGATFVANLPSPSVSFNLPLESETEGKDGGIVICDNFAYSFTQPLSISGDVAVRDGGIFLPNAADTATVPRFFGDGSFTLRNAPFTYLACSADKKLQLATAEGKGVTFEGAGLIRFRRPSGGTISAGKSEGYSAQTLVSGPLTRSGKGSVLFLWDGCDGYVGEEGRSSYKVNGGVANHASGIAGIPVVATKINSSSQETMDFLTYDEEKGFRPFTGTVDLGSSTSATVAHTDPGSGLGYHVSREKSAYAVRMKSGYITLAENAVLKVGDGTSPALFLLNRRTSLFGPGTVDFGTSEGVFLCTSYADDDSFVISAPITGSGGVSFVSVPDHDFSYRRIALDAANTYTGGTFINSVRVELRDAQALGGGTVHIGGGKRYGGRLAFAVDAEIANDFEIAGRGIRNTKSDGYQNRAALECLADVNLTGDVELTELARAAVPANGKRLTLFGTVSGDALEIVHGSSDEAGTVALTGHNAYTGGTEVVYGTFAVAHADGAGTGRVLLDNATLRFENTSAVTFTNDISGVGAVSLAGGAEVKFTGDISGLEADLELASSVTFTELPPFKTIRNTAGSSVTLSLAPGLGTVAWDGRTLENGAKKIRLSIGEGTVLDLGGATLEVRTALDGSASRVTNGTLTETVPQTFILIVR